MAELVGEGLHHGVEVHADVLEHAREMCRQQGKHYIKFFHANINDVDTRLSPRYERIYVGACVSRGSKEGIMQLLDIGGILVGPFDTPRGQQIRKVVRLSATHFEVTNLKTVSFGQLVSSTAKAEAPPFVLPYAPWTPESHHRYSRPFCAALLEVLLCTTRKESPLHVFPRELLVNHVFGYVHPRWFDAPAASGEAALVEVLRGTAVEEDEAEFVARRVHEVPTRSIMLMMRHQRAFLAAAWARIEAEAEGAAAPRAAPAAPPPPPRPAGAPQPQPQPPPDHAMPEAGAEEPEPGAPRALTFLGADGY